MHSSYTDGVLTLTFNRPERLNALTAGDMDAMARALERAGNDPTVRVVVLAGEGRAFCSGADLGVAADIAEQAGETIDAANRLSLAIIGCTRPVVARARGVVAGVGVSFALACDLVLCDDESYLLLAFTRVGLMPDGGATALVAAAVGRTRAMRMALLAEKLPADAALAAGLVSQVWSVGDYDREADALVARLVKGPAAAYGRTKLAINGATLPQLPHALAIERFGQDRLLRAGDFREGAAAFAGRRAATFMDLPDVADEFASH